MSKSRLFNRSFVRALGSFNYTSNPLNQQTQVGIVIGQSPALGMGVNAAANGLTARPSILYTYKHSLLSNPPNWVTEGRIGAAPRTLFISTSYPVGSYGPDLGIANYIADNTSAKWELAAMAIDGMSLKQHLLNPAWPLGGPPLLQQVKDFITSVLTASGGVLNFIHYDQGQADAAASPDNTEYAANLALLLSELRASFGSSFRFFVTRLHSGFSGNSSNVIRAAQETLQNADPLVSIVSVDQLALRDFAHLTDAGIRDEGFAVGALALNGAPTGKKWYASGVIASKPSTGTLAPTVPTSNKLGILAIAGIGNTAYAPPAGWTHIATAHDDLVLLSARLQLYWRWLQSGDSVSIADLPADDAASAVVMSFDGMSQTAPIDAVATSTTTTATTTITIPGITTTTQALLLKVTAGEADSNNAQMTISTDWIEQVDYSSTNGSGTSLMAATKLVNPGTHAGSTATLASASTSATIVVALK